MSESGCPAGHRRRRRRAGANGYALRVSGLSKTFGATRALQDVSIDIRAGEIHALMGQNGSGKSTLIKSLAGYHQPDNGADGGARRRAVRHRPRGVRTGCASSTRTSGSCSSSARRTTWRCTAVSPRASAAACCWREQEKTTRELLERFDVDIDIHQPLAAATPVERTVVAIAAALQGWHGGGGLLVLDEPTAVLPHDEVERLFAVVEEVRKAGTAVLYVSHRMDEIFQIADRVTILRGGKLVATKDVDAIDPRALAGLMVGEDVDPDYRAPVGGQAGRPDRAGDAQRRRQVAATASTCRCTRARSSASPGLRAQACSSSRT